MHYKYQRTTDQFTTWYFRNNQDNEATEIGEVDGWHYVFVPEGVTLPDQPAEINWTAVTLTDTLREAIKTASPQCRLIASRMVEQIRASYSIDDEMYFARIGVGAATGLYTPTADEMQAMTVFGEFVEGVRQWGRDERAKIGL